MARLRSLTPNEITATKLFVAIRQIWLIWLQTQGGEHWASGFITDAKFFVIHLAIRHKTEPPIEALQTMLAGSLQSMRSVATWY